MAAFDERTRAFERQFVLKQEHEFEVEAHCDRLLGLWAAECLGKNEADAAAYAADVIVADIEAGGRDGVIRKIVTDLAPLSISEEHIRQKASALLAEATLQAR